MVEGIAALVAVATAAVAVVVKGDIREAATALVFTVEVVAVVADVWSFVVAAIVVVLS